MLVVDQHVDVLPSFFEEAGPGRVLGRVEDGKSVLAMSPATTKDKPSLPAPTWTW